MTQMEQEILPGNNTSGAGERDRIAWIDVLRGLLIILMVLGHATGRFNAYIYQFHIGAFFLLSGYTENIKGKCLTEIIYRKAKRLLLPYVTMFFTLLVVTVILDKLGCYETIFGMPMPDPWFVIREFMTKGSCYVWWLGACWFLPVLFFSSLLAKVWVMISKKYYLAISLALYIVAYEVVLPNQAVRYRDFDLVMIAQFYFCCGFALRDFRILERLDGKKWGEWVYLAVLLFGAFVLGFVRNNYRLTMDWPSRHFNYFYTDLLMVIAGFCAVLAIAKGISKTFLQKSISYVGKHTMGIVLLHFVFMKVAILILAWMNQATSEDISRIVPTEAVGNAWFFPIVLFSVGLSIVVYRWLCLVPGYRILLGMGKTDRFLPELERLAGKVSGTFHRKQMRLLQHIARSGSRIEPWKWALIICGILIVLFVSVSQVVPRIMINDELQARYWYLKGPAELFKHDVDVKVNKEGRVLAALSVPISNLVGYLGTHIEIYKAIQWIIILIDVVLIAWLLYEITKDKQFALIFCFFSILCLPITFEHTAPNAFVAYYGLPFASLVLSVILYRRHLYRNDKKQIIGSAILLFWGLTAYEAFVMLMPIYFFISWQTNQKENPFGRRMQKTLKQLRVPIATTLIYIISYFLLRKIFPTHYQGTDIGFTIPGAINIIKQLFLSALPGYYLVNGKYRYLTYIYGNGSDILKNVQPLHYLLFFALITGVVILHKKASKIDSQNKQYLRIGCISLLCSLLLTIPNSIASMYQGNVNAESFIALPCSCFVFFLHILTITSLLCGIRRDHLGRFIWGGMCVMMCIIGTMVQIQNSIFVAEQSSDYVRMEEIEKLIRSEGFKTLNGKRIYAPDLYKQKNALYIHEGYWTSFAGIYGLNTQISGTDKDSEIQIDFVDDAYFMVTDKESGNKTMITSGSHQSSEEQKSGAGLYETEGEIYADGWIGKGGTVHIQTGSTGKVHLVFYNPLMDNTGKRGTLSWEEDGTVKTQSVQIEEGFFEAEIIGRPLSECSIHIDFADAAARTSQEDLRDLSVILSEVYVEEKDVIE